MPLVSPSAVRRRRALCAIVAVPAFLLGGACAGGGAGGVTPPGNNNPPGSANPIATNAVALRGSTFIPSSIVVAPSTQVQFTNEDGVDHNVTFSNPSITGLSAFSSGAGSVQMPSAQGTYGYRCTLHAGMTGSVQVQ